MVIIMNLDIRKYFVHDTYHIPCEIQSVTINASLAVLVIMIVVSTILVIAVVVVVVKVLV